MGVGKGWEGGFVNMLLLCVFAWPPFQSSKGQFLLLGSHSALASFPPLGSLIHCPESTYVGSPSSVDWNNLWKGAWPVLFIT